MIDILLQEEGSGGEIIIRNMDVVTTSGNENQLYIAQFGGADSWMNGLLFTGDQQHTSQTEGALLVNPLTSAGRIAIENAMTNDLEFLADDTAGTTVSINTSIVAKNRLNAAYTINGTAFYMNWTPDTSFLTYSLIE